MKPLLRCRASRFGKHKDPAHLRISVLYLTCCRFRGHRDRCFMEPEVGYGATAIYAGVQA
jgi:hypothetical protein